MRNYRDFLINAYIARLLPVIPSGGPVNLATGVVGVLAMGNGGNGVPLASTSIVTTAGPFAVTNENLLILNKAAASATVINLPLISTRSGLPFRVVDLAGNAGPVTINAHAGDAIMTLTNVTLQSYGAGAGVAADITLIPELDSVTPNWVLAT